MAHSVYTYENYELFDASGLNPLLEEPTTFVHCRISSRKPLAYPTLTVRHPESGLLINPLGQFEGYLTVEEIIDSGQDYDFQFLEGYRCRRPFSPTTTYIFKDYLSHL